MNCKNCGRILNQDEKFCANCGLKVENEINFISNEENHQKNILQQQEANEIKFSNHNTLKKKKNISLLIGIISLILVFIFQIFIMPLSIVGIVFGIISVKENKRTKAGLILNIISLVLAVPMLLLHIKIFGLNLSSNPIDDDFREYLINNYNVDLAEKSTVGRCIYVCDYFGYYPLSDDLTYAIQISKTGNEYEVSYDPKSVQMRKELYKYISTQKGNNYVENYLKFYDNGDKGHLSSVNSYGDHLSYIVYYDDSIDINKQIRSDYQILKKANEIISSNSDQFIGFMEVFYIQDNRLKQDNWLENLKIDFNYYSLAPMYLDGDKKIYTSKYKYHYIINDPINLGNIGTWTFEQFEQEVYNNLESK